MVRRHANFVNFFDAELSLSAKQDPGLCRKERVRTFELPTNFDHVWEWHMGGKVETDEFDNQPFDCQQPLSILFENLCRQSLVVRA